MTTITKERLLAIKQWRETYGPGSNVVLPAEEAEELARIALASLEAKPIGAFHIAEQQVDGTSDYLKDGEWPIDNGIIEVYAAPPVPVVPAALPENDDEDGHDIDYLEPSEVYALGRTAGWNACRAAMLQSGNFREIAETSTNYPVIPSEVLSAIQKVAKIRADFDDFDGDRRGIGDCLDEAEQELIVTINKYASQLAAEPIAPNDVREQTAIPQVPVTPDGWISCSERMPNTKTAVLVAVEFDRKGDWRMKWATYIPGHPDANDGWIIPGASWKPSHWMPLPEPPQEVNQ
ncbi:DUF551 domain-containing protein [Escherichia coli]|uniref:DUF551 domain-containing protein n=1 Tax=Escherichia coli TaxID=562 RepID=A0A8S7TA99_ECOLX|nr:DUF551 domain-containing protein [Escherichia coli]EFH6096944.1 DUF551 domain-containing protein [Escherichia coli]EIJ0345534.1 DUF551 domain-containing protein [Escherichia coli]EIM6672025.1 DUF551 domain-containing protein [Escherichia coli]EIN4569321.1 DUF551 domain-containing protein [Escherichia coli]